MTPSSPTILRAACHENNVQQVTAILRGPRHIWEGELDGCLYEAVCRNSRPLIQLLLSKGARFGAASFPRLCSEADLETLGDVFGPGGLDVNTTEFGGECALRLAVDRIDVMEWLLARGADPNLRGKREVTPLATAVADGLCDSVDVLLAHGAVLEDDILVQALSASTCEHVDLSIVKHLIGKGAGVNNVVVLDPGPPKYTGPIEPERGTPLHLAAKLDDAEAAQILLDAGADPDVVADGETPCQLAKSLDSMEVYELLSSRAVQAAPNLNTSSS